MLLSINSTTFLYQFSLFLCLYFQWGENSVFYICTRFSIYTRITQYLESLQRKE